MQAWAHARILAVPLLALILSVPATGIGTGPVAAAENASRAAATDARSSHAGAADFDEKQALAISQGAIGKRVGALDFVDANGNPVNLSQFLGKPLVISLVYTSCYHTCPLITENLDHAVKNANNALGVEKLNVVTIGFDARYDTPDRMKNFARNHGVDRPNWHMLSGDEETIKALAKDVGFIFFPSPRGFDHLAQTTILNKDGEVYTQVYGANFPIPGLVEPLKDLVFGRERDFTTLEGIANRIRLFCTLYDPRDDRYYFDYSVFIGIIIGVLCLGGVGTVLIRNIWRLWRNSKAHQA